MGIRHLALAGALFLGAFGAIGAAAAADLRLPSPPPIAPEPVAFGGWYLRGDVGAVWANLIAVGATATLNTWANRRYTFGYRDSRERGRHYLGGVAISLAGLGLSSLALASVTGSTAQVVALLTTWSLTTMARFVLLRHWVFLRARLSWTS